MATFQGQDVIPCQLCPNSVEHHCNYCGIDLCNKCVSTHLADKSRKHEVVEYTSRKETLVLPVCETHHENQCETFCKTCTIPICHQCFLGSHRNHNIIEMKNIIEKCKLRIRTDTQELRTTIVPKYTKVKSFNSGVEFDKILSEIKDQEEKICQAVHQEGILLRDAVKKKKKEVEEMNEENKNLAANTEKLLNAIIQTNDAILKSNDATAIMNYESFDGNVRKGPKILRFQCPNFSPCPISQHQIRKMFGSLHSSNLSEKQFVFLKMMENPKVLKTLQSPYGKFGKRLWQVQCMQKNLILTSGRVKTLNLINKSGSVLQEVTIESDVAVLSINLDQAAVFTAVPFRDTKVYIYRNRKVDILLDLVDWCPKGLYHTGTRDLLVSMRSKDRSRSRSRVVLYSEMTPIQVIQYDTANKPLFSTGCGSGLRLTENGNGDICVADYAANAVVVVNASGELRFRYQGNLSTQTLYTEFQPLEIAANINHQILVSDFANNIIHIIDCDGNFVRYIKRPCSAGLSIDTDNNLVIGEYYTGKIRIVKYLE